MTEPVHKQFKSFALATNGDFLSRFKYRPPNTIPRREWLYNRHYIRRFVSTTVAPGGVGKSLLAIIEALSMATGKGLLGPKPEGKFKVGYWNGEDPLEETERRIAAAILHYGLDGPALEEDFFWGSGREGHLTIAETTRDGTTICMPDVQRVVEAVQRAGIDVLTIDPFVSSHRVSENDNGAIAQVANVWAEIAEHCNCSIELVHHTRKGSGPTHEVTVEDGRGAVALLYASRTARVLNPMTEREAEAIAAGVVHRRLYFRADNGKANLTPPPASATWYHMVSVDLGNTGDDEQLTAGDSVGVVTSWKWPDPFEGISSSDVCRVLEEIARGNWRENVQANAWVGKAVALALGLDLEQKHTKAKVKALLKAWLKNDVLVVVTHKDDHGEDRQFVEVGKRVGP